MQTKRAVIILHPTLLTLLPLVTSRRNPSPFIAKIENPADEQQALSATPAQCQPLYWCAAHLGALGSSGVFAILHRQHALLLITAKVLYCWRLNFGLRIQYV